MSLQDEKGARIATAQTDAKAAYRFVGIRAGRYTLHAEKITEGSVTSGPVKVSNNQPTEITLTLVPASAASSAQGTAPEFFDQPKFTVAGVTDASNHGAHGSDATYRTSRSLAKDLPALDRNPSRPSLPPSNAIPSLKDEANRQPENFEAQYRLGLELVKARSYAQASPYLERAHRLKPDDYESARLLARSYAELGQSDKARETAEAVLAKKDTAEMHQLLADIAEKQKDPMRAVREYQRAAELQPDESHLFDWGAELLLHQALEPAVEVFTKGSHSFPQSARMLIGLGVASYARGSADLAAKYLCQATDIAVADPSPYLVLGRMQITDPAQAPAILARMERFAHLHPDDARANYYYALALWKNRRNPDTAATSQQIEQLLEKAVKLDPTLAEGFLQIGVFQQERGDMAKATAAYQKAIALDPQLGEAHYRLAQVYRRNGEGQKAEAEIKLYNQISQKTAADLKQEGREIPQFVYTLRDSTSTQSQ